MQNGYLLLSRNLQDNWLWTAETFTKGQAWVDLIMLANYQDGFLLVRGVRIEVRRGQVGRSEDSLCKRWKWSKTKLKNFLNMLESDQQIIQQKSNILNVLTILNYDYYQKPVNKTDNKKPTENIQKTTNKEKKENNKKKESIIIGKIDLIEMQNSFLDVDVKSEFEKFEDYCKSKGTKYKDHKAAFRNWCRNSIKFKQGQNNANKSNNGQYYKPTQGQEAEAAIARLGERYGINPSQI